MNKKILVAGIMMGGLMLFSGAVAKLISPTIKIADTRPAVDLNRVIPLQFGDWEEDKAQVSSVVNPTTEAALKEIYAQTLSRTYVNRSGERIMLSIAYGTDQSDNLSVHFPEGCYVGQGFGVTPTAFEKISTTFGEIPAARLVANMYTRIEPVTYWIVVGDKVVVVEMTGTVAVGGVVSKRLLRVSMYLSNIKSDVFSFALLFSFLF